MLRFWPLRRADLPLIGGIEYGFANFVLVLQYVAPHGWKLRLLQVLFPRRGYYLIRAHLLYKSMTIFSLVRKHRLDRAGLFLDEVTANKARQYEKNVAEQADKLRADGDVFVLPLVLLGQSIILGMQEGKVVRINVQTLASGVNVAGTMEELQDVAGTLIGAVDTLAKKIELALRFEQQEIRVFAPGEKQKPKKDKPGTSPSNWGK